MSIELLAYIIQPINWPIDIPRQSSRRQPPADAMTNHEGHRVFSNGHLYAVPNCGCEHCKAVFDDWGSQAVGWARWQELKREDP